MNIKIFLNILTYKERLLSYKSNNWLQAFDNNEVIKFFIYEKALYAYFKDYIQ